MFVLDGEAECSDLSAQLLARQLEEVNVGREGAQQVQDVVSPVVADDTLALHTRAQLHLLVLVIDHLVRQDLQLLRGFVQLSTRGPVRKKEQFC